MRKVLNPIHQADYDAGYRAKMDEIHEMGFDAANHKFNDENPIGKQYHSTAAYYYSSGEVDALYDVLLVPGVSSREGY